MSSFTDKGGYEWHLLEKVTSNGRVTEVMAAANIDGIGVLAVWTLDDNNKWVAKAIDTEGGLKPIRDDDGEAVPAKPPRPWTLPGMPICEPAYSPFGDPLIAHDDCVQYRLLIRRPHDPSTVKVIYNNTPVAAVGEKMPTGGIVPVEGRDGVYDFVLQNVTLKTGEYFEVSYTTE